MYRSSEINSTVYIGNWQAAHTVTITQSPNSHNNSRWLFNKSVLTIIRCSQLQFWSSTASISQVKKNPQWHQNICSHSFSKSTLFVLLLYYSMFYMHNNNAMTTSFWKWLKLQVRREITESKLLLPF